MSKKVIPQRIAFLRLSAFALVAFANPIAPLGVDAQPQLKSAPFELLSEDPITDYGAPHLIALSCILDEDELSKEAIAGIEEDAKEYKQHRDKTPPEGTLELYYGSRCRPSKEVKKYHDDQVKKDYQGETIDCDQNPKPAGCPDLKPTLIVRIPGREPITIEGKPGIKKFLEELKK
jgi:hypothetical protein